MKKRFSDNIGKIVKDLLKDDLFANTRSDKQLKEIEVAAAAAHEMPYSFLINSLLGSGLDDGEEMARSIWRHLLSHRKALSKIVGRTVPLRAAAIDWIYLQDEKNRLLKPIIVSRDILQSTLNQGNLDNLTGLLLRGEFLVQLDECLAQTPFVQSTLVFIDLDGFKEVNDSMGHHQGDLLLKDFASLTAGALRSTDVIGRLGGDEFAFLLLDAHKALSREILLRLRRSFDDKHRSLGVSFSFGITALKAKEDASNALKRADRAMYREKRTRKKGSIVQN